MTVTTTSPAAGVTRTLLDQSTKLSAALNLRAPAATAATSVDSNFSIVDKQESSAVETSALSQSPTVSFRIDALNIAFVGTKVDLVDSGAAQVSRLLGQLQSLATQASSSGLSKSALLQLDGQFQAVRLAINNVPPGPPNDQITVESLTQGLPVSSTDSKAVVGGFNDKTLLGEANLTTPEAAQTAVATVADAQKTIDAQRVVLSNVQSDVDFASASIDTAIQNQDAARATLSAADLGTDTAPGTSLIASLQADPNAAIAAQTTRLPANILQLLSQ